MRRRRMSWLGAGAALALLAGCVAIPTSGGVTTVQVSADDLEDPLPTLPEGPRDDASPEQIIADFLVAGRGPKDNYAVARQYLTDEFKATWRPGARVLISSSPIAPDSLADNTWSVDISASAAVDGEGRYQAALPADVYDLTFGLVQNNDGQWRINSAPDGTVVPPNSFAAIFDSYEVYFFDPSFDYLVPDLRWFRTGSTAVRNVVDAVLAGPSETFGDGALFSAFPEGVERVGEPEIESGLATVPLSPGVSSGGTTAHRRMVQQLLQSLRSVASVREVEIDVNGFALDVPDGGAQADSAFLVGNDLVGGAGGRVGVLTGQGVTAITGIGRAADGLGVTAASIVSRDRTSMALLSPAGVSIARDGQAPVVLDDRPGLIAPSLDPLGYTWTVQAGSPGGLSAIGPDGERHPVGGLPTDARVVSLDVSRDGARLLAALQTTEGPRLMVFGIQRDGDLVPTGLVTPLDLRIGATPIRDAAWIDGVTVVVLSEGVSTSVDAYDIGGQHTSLGALSGGVSVVGGNTVDGTRVLDDQGNVLRPGGGTSWQDTGIDATFLATQQ